MPPKLTIGSGAACKLITMFQLKSAQDPSTAAFVSLATMMRRLGETFVVRDVMVDASKIRSVAPGAINEAEEIVQKKRYSVIPVWNGETFEAAFHTNRLPGEGRTVMHEQAITVADHIPDSTPLAEAFLLFASREWYLTLKGNRVSGLITYWEFNSHEFRVQLYTVLSLIEELSRNLLASDGCGVNDATGLNLDAEKLKTPLERFQKNKQTGDGNRFVDELDFHQVDDALKQHELWREFILSRVTKTQLDEKYCFTTLRDDVMHGRTVFPTYDRFKKRQATISRMVEWIDYLYAYMEPKAKLLPV